MKFLVTRTSARFDDASSPCDEAHLEPYVSTSGWRKTHLPPSWLMEGRNHREDGEFAYRDTDRQGWFVEFKSLQDLIAFTLKHGQVVVVVVEHCGNNPPTIEIYDDYRE